jgi:hypothetical protein
VTTANETLLIAQTSRIITLLEQLVSGSSGSSVPAVVGDVPAAHQKLSKKAQSMPQLIAWKERTKKKYPALAESLEKNFNKQFKM